MKTKPKFCIGDFVQLTEEGRQAFPTKVLTYPWRVTYISYEHGHWQIRVEHKGQRVNRMVRENYAEDWLEASNEP